MNDKYLIPISLIISTVIMVIAFYFITHNQISKYKKELVKTEESKTKIELVNDKDHILGSKSAKLFIIVYTDLECPSCKRFYGYSKSLEEKYKKNKDIAFVFRHYPLFQKIGGMQAIHPTAGIEAVATECAAKLGGEKRFWDMVDKIFASTKSDGKFDLNKLTRFADLMNLDEDDFKKCLGSEEVNNFIKDEVKKAIWTGIKGTPSVYIQSKVTGENYPIKPNIRKIDMIISNFLKNN